MPLGPAPPFEVVTLVVENRTDNGLLRFDADEVLLDGAEIETAGRPSRALSIPAIDVQLRAGETRTFRVPANRNTLEVAGAAGRAGGTIAPFEVGSGTYALTESGLVRSFEPTPELVAAVEEVTPLYRTFYPATTDARSFLAAGIPALNLASDLPGHALPRHMHSQADNRSLVSLEALDDHVRVLTEVARRLDAARP